MSCGTPSAHARPSARQSQAVARKLGCNVGQKRSRALKRRLVDAGVIDTSGAYRQPYKDQETRSGYRVTLYRLAAGVLRFA